MEIGVITNPNSRKNSRKRNRTEVLQAIVGDLGEVHQTPNPDAIKPIIRSFLRRHARYWVSDGGDGALHWMLRSTLEVLQEEEFAGHGMTLPLAMPTNSGTIDFVAHNVGLKGNAETLLQALRTAVETDRYIPKAEVDSMWIEGEQEDGAGNGHPFRTLGFAVAAGGIGQRFFEKLFEAGDHSTATIVSVLGKIVASSPVALSPLRRVPGMPDVLRSYANEVFRPTRARVTVDGERLPYEECTGIHVGSMSIELGGIFRFFCDADVRGQMHAIIGSPPPSDILRNIPRAYLGKPMKARDLVDGPCRTVEIEAVGDELLAPVIDGELYHDVRRMVCTIGPRIRIPRVSGNIN